VAIDLSIIRSQLEGERKRLLGDLEQINAGAADMERRVGSPFGKREEEATESFELEKRLALEKRLRDSLAEVERALQKFKEGTYGQCDECGKLIAPERLEALPQANLCVECKANQAKNAKGKFPPA